MGCKRFLAGVAFVGIAWGSAAQILPPVYFEDFDRSVSTLGAEWAPARWGGEATQQVSKHGRGEGRCLMVKSAGCDAGWSTKLPIEPHSVYRLSGWISTDLVVTNKGLGAMLNLHNLQRIHTPALTGTNDWTRVEVVFDSGELSTLEVNCLLGGWGMAAGTAYFDDIRLDLLTQDNLYPAVRLYGDRVQAPISKYVYGQFIEHLGRCIYGGIWAEMLADRKFYYGVGEKESPWKAAGKVKMLSEGAFVGEHMPVVSLNEAHAGGILQGGLGVVAGKEYVGRVVLAGSGTVTVSLVWGAGPEDRAVAEIGAPGDAFNAFPFSLTAGAASDEATLEITAVGSGELRIGTASLMPADNVDGMRADTLALLKELNAPVYRWPGGNFVSGYDWHDGIGERDRRPPRKNPAWKGVEHNDFGADEFMHLLEILNSEAYVVVNSGLGGVDSAVEQIEYFTGDSSTEGGKKRIANGHAAPYSVPFIGVGNEMYGDWQLGHMPLEDYVKKHNEFAEALRRVAPGAKLVAVGATGTWSETMLRECGGHMDLLSEHFYCQDRPELISYVAQIPDNIREKVVAHRDYLSRIPELAGKTIPICMDEWNYWHGPEIYGELGTQYALRDALGIAAGLNAYYRASDIIGMANYAQTMNVIGAIKTTKTAACMDTTGVVLALYRREFGTLPIKTEGESFPVDFCAAWTEDRSELTVSLVNPTHEAYDVAIGVEGMEFPKGGTRWIITGADPMAKNVPGETPGVTVAEEALNGEMKSFPAPPMSAVLYRVK